MEQRGDPNESSPLQDTAHAPEKDDHQLSKGFRRLQCGFERSPRQAKQSGDSTAPGLRPLHPDVVLSDLRAGSTTQPTKTGNASAAPGATGD